MKENCCGRMRARSPEELRRLTHRLNRLEGQIRGIRGMLEKEAYCADILVQVASAALNGFAKELLSEHIHTCVVKDIQAGKMETTDELIAVLQRLF